MIGWFSAKQCAFSGSSYYRTPNGERVEVTEVTETDTHRIAWDDVKCVGVVSEYGGRASEPWTHTFALAAPL